jgi:hypothetical protein
MGMKSRLTRVAIGIALAAPVLGIGASPASADTVVMGSPLVNNYDGGVSNSALTAQLSFDPATSTNPVVSPVNGTITDWKVKSADDGAVYTLKVLRPNGPVSIVPATNTNFTAITSVQAPSAVPNGTFAATPTGVIFDYPASLPISKGDYIGVVTVGGPGAHGLPQAMANGLPQSTFANNFASQPADGASANLLADAQHELLLQATITFSPEAQGCKVPNAVGQTEAAASAAMAGAGCTSKVTRQQLNLRAIRKSFSTKKKKRIRAANAALRAQDGKVLNQKPAAGETAAPGTPVELIVAQVVAPPKKKHKKKQ